MRFTEIFFWAGAGLGGFVRINSEWFVTLEWGYPGMCQTSITGFSKIVTYVRKHLTYISASSYRTSQEISLCGAWVVVGHSTFSLDF